MAVRGRPVVAISRPFRVSPTFRNSLDVMLELMRTKLSGREVIEKRGFAAVACGKNWPDSESPVECALFRELASVAALCLAIAMMRLNPMRNARR
jgi:hypothetical protein